MSTIRPPPAAVSRALAAELQATVAEKNEALAEVDALRKRQARQELREVHARPARSVLPLASLRGPNRGLAHMGSRSLGSELYRRPMARRDRIWVRHGAAPSGQTPCWGRQSRFIKRGRPLLVAEHFLPALWRRVEDMDR